jgi:hypothetical protein
MKLMIPLSMLVMLQCGYRMIGWHQVPYESLGIVRVQAAIEHQELMPLLEDELRERILALSGMTLVPSDEAQLRLETKILAFEEMTIATAADGRESRVQFNIVASFKARTADGAVLWSLDHYPHSDQYDVTVSGTQLHLQRSSALRAALRTMSERAVANLSIALSRKPIDPSSAHEH